MAPGLIWGVPFAGMLLSIALGPMLAPRFWHRRMGLVALGWSLALILPQAIAFGPSVAFHAAWHAMLVDYLPFVAVLLAMYAVGGGILIEGGPWGTPAGNTALLAIGTLLAASIGPLATSMVLIHPLLRANAHRPDKLHMVVLFIILVCNVGGVTTALGNPPLYIGLLQGVPFFWPLVRLWPILLTIALPLLALFWLLDRRSAARATAAPRPTRLHVRGLGNIALLAGLIVVVIAQGAWQPGDITLLGAPVGIERLAGVALFAAAAALSAATTPRAVRQANMFSWEPMEEVAKLFAGIFVTITPMLDMMQAGTAGPLAPILRLTATPDGAPLPLAYFWLSGTLSAFLDNAPTYFLFFQLAGGDATRLTADWATTLAAMSAGSVCFGALTYIGNAPNMMVRGVAAHRGVRMPGFFGYMAWACALLLPLFALVTLLFFR